MNCLKFGLMLDEHLSGALPPDLELACLQHLNACGACARRCEAARSLLWRLRALPGARPDPEFADRVFAAARRAHAPATARRLPLPAWPGALAAGLVLAIGVLSWTTRESMPEVHAGALEPVRLVFRSEQALQGVTIELELPEGVELAGYPGERRLVWQTELRVGENLLELPVRSSGAGGVLTATLNLGTERRRFSVRLVAAGDTAPVTHAAERDASAARRAPGAGEFAAHA